MADICGSIDAIQNLGANIIGLFLKKRIQLQRLAKLISDAAFDVPIPNIGSLLKLSEIGQATYNQLRASCPQLGLPPASKGLGQLQNAVRDGYQGLINQMRDHPAQALKGLEDELGNLLGQAEAQLFKAIGPGMNFAKCLSALCHTGETLAAAAENFPNEVAAQFQSLKDNVSNYGKLLDQSQQNLLNRVQAAQTGLTQLIDIPRAADILPHGGDDIPPSFIGSILAPGDAANAGNDARAGGTGIQSGAEFTAAGGAGDGTVADSRVADVYANGFGLDKDGNRVSMSSLVRDGYCGMAVRQTLEQTGYFPSNPGLSSGYMYADYLNALAADPNSGVRAVYVTDRSQVPADGITVYDAITRNPRESGGVFNGHVQIGSNYNGSGRIADRWIGQDRNGVGGVYYQFTRPPGR